MGKHEDNVFRSTKDVKLTDAATDCIASEIRVERGRVKCLSEAAQECKRADVCVCVIKVRREQHWGEAFKHTCP